MTRQILLIVLSLFWFASCEFTDQEKTEDAIARVHDKYLNKADISDLLAKLEGGKDSATIVANYINGWIQQELLLERAEFNLSEEEKDFQKLLEDYRRSLVIYEFQKQWVIQNLDTIVKDEEITDYYESNQANFELKENIVKVRYVVVPKNAPKLKKLEQKIQGTKKEDRQEFHDYCLQYATLYFENDSVWLPFDEILGQVPLEIDSKEDFLKRNKFVVSVDSNDIYMLYISDYKIKSSASPLSFERDKIRSIIINQRKLSLLSAMKDEMFKAALKKGKAEIY